MYITERQCGYVWDLTISWDSMLKAGYMKNSHGDGPIQCCKEAVSAFNPHQLHSINEWIWHPSRGHVFMDVLRTMVLPSHFSLLQPTLP